jgi:hypothetical protein
MAGVRYHGTSIAFQDMLSMTSFTFRQIYFIFDVCVTSYTCALKMYTEVGGTSGFIQNNSKKNEKNLQKLISQTATVFEILRNLCRFAGGKWWTGVTVGDPPASWKQGLYRRATEAAHGKYLIIH